MSDYANRFLRFRPGLPSSQTAESIQSLGEQLPQHATHQSGDVTRNEINEGPGRFWAEMDFPPHSLAASNAAMTAVELTAREGSIDALHAVLARDPDVSFWLFP